MNDSLNLYNKESSVGKIVYYFSTMVSFFATFIGLFGYDANFLYYPALILMTSVTAAILNQSYFYFNNLTISILYRFSLIIILTNITLQIYMSENIKTPISFLLICFMTSLMSLGIGAVWSIPFKLLSYIMGSISNFKVLYSKNDRIPDFLNKNNETNEDNRFIEYESYNETQLEAALNLAVKDEDYALIEVIKKHLEKFRD